MLSYFNNLSNTEIFFLCIGFLGQGVFASRFIFQWIYSEKKGESAIPVIFWYLSIIGGIGLLTYAVFRADPVIIVGQLFGIFIYLRNLFLIYRKKIRKKFKIILTESINIYHQKNILFLTLLKERK